MGIASDIAVEWDFDGDGDFSESVEDITSYVLSGESVTGRNWPSMLQGKATPGSLRLTLDNSDDRFSFFNSSSPLNTGAFDLKLGRRIRMRTDFATPNDPVRLAYDRFGGTGAIGTTENGLTWTSPTGSWTRTDNTSNRGELETTAALAYALFDPSVTDGYLQAQHGVVDHANLCGLIYRYTDASNLGLVYFNGSDYTIKHAQNVAGTFTILSSTSVDNIDGAYIGVNVQGTAASIYWNGVNLVNETAYAGTGDQWGLYAEWPGAANQRAPYFYEMYMFDDVWATAAGMMWTGVVSSCVPSVDNSGRKIAQVTARGPLEAMADVTVLPKVTTGSSVFGGMNPGQMIGNIFGHANQLHPPGLISPGQFQLGPNGLPEQKALQAARVFEEAEQGFIYESPEGFLRFDEKADRGASASAATWSDDPAEQFNYESFELLDWRREIVNQVESSISTQLPGFIAGASPAQDTALGVQAFLDINLGAFTAVAGDLIIVAAISSVHTVGELWITPPGWVNLRPGVSDERGLLRMFAKVMTADDLGKTVRFYNDTAVAGGSITASVTQFRNWRGDISDGVAVAFNGLGEFPTQVEARLGNNDPPLLFVPWDREPCHFLVMRAGARGNAAPVVAAAADNVSPNGYGNMSSTYTNSLAGDAYDTAMQLASRVGGASVEDPSPFLGTFTGFNHVECATIAIRGAPAVRVVTRDRDSQLDHGVRSHVSAAQVFPDSTEAGDYNDEVIARYAEDAPIVRIGFTATQDNAYRAQADTRRVGDRITLEANNGAGMGISGDYIVESVRHRFNRGETYWRCEWELSQV